MANWAQKLADRFKPRVGERLKQSAEAKKQMKDQHLGLAQNPKPKPQPPPKSRKPALIDNRPTRLLESSTTSVDARGEVTVRQIWREWQSIGTLGTTTCNHYATTGDTWSHWASQTTGGLLYDTNVWNAWVTSPRITVTSGYENSIADAAAWGAWQAQEQPRRSGRSTEQERQYRAEQKAREEKWQAEHAAANAKWHEEERIRLRKKEEADERAMKLLVSMLDDRQRSDLKAYKYFFVEAPSGRLYRIDHGMHGNVKVVDRVTRKIIERLCIQPSGVPAADANLMQKLLIETAEDHFRANANITLENGSVVMGRREPLDDAALDNVIPIRRAA
jgi:hypothetical protein